MAKSNQCSSILKGWTIELSKVVYFIQIQSTVSTCSEFILFPDVIAYVDVWSSNKTENYSKPFIDHLRELGAEVSFCLLTEEKACIFCS